MRFVMTTCSPPGHILKFSNTWSICKPNVLKMGNGCLNRPRFGIGKTKRGIKEDLIRKLIFNTNPTRKSVQRDDLAKDGD